MQMMLKSWPVRSLLIVLKLYAQSNTRCLQVCVEEHRNRYKSIKAFSKRIGASVQELEAKRRELRFQALDDGLFPAHLQ